MPLVPPVGSAAARAALSALEAGTPRPTMTPERKIATATTVAVITTNTSCFPCS
jgi:hypothetical protein